ncbi:MAG TPA: DJ-1/PfpI family protein [Chthoniobacterales bacterium]
MAPVMTGRRLVLVVVPPVRELDLVGVVDVFASANQFLPEERHYRIEIVTTGTEQAIAGMQGVQFVGGQHFSEFTGEIDTLLIPGGVGIETTDPTPAVVSWLKHSAGQSRRVGSICTGAFLLARAGLLDGRRATTHWASRRSWRPGSRP